MRDETRRLAEGWGTEIGKHRESQLWLFIKEQSEDAERSFFFFFLQRIPRKGSALTARNILECSSEKEIKRTSGQSLLTLQPARRMNMQPWSSSMQTDGTDS